MALCRCLLRRIVPGSGVLLPRATTVQASPAPPISRRFMGSVSPQGEPSIHAVLHEEGLVGVESAKFRRDLEECDRLYKEIGEINRATSIILDERDRQRAESRKFKNARMVVVAAMPFVVIMATHYLVAYNNIDLPSI